MAGELMPPEPAIRCRNLTKAFGGRAATDRALALARDGATRNEIQQATGATLAVHDVSFSVEPGELFVVMGLSGSAG